MNRHPRACRAPGCAHLAPTRDPLCLRCQHGGRLPTRLGAWAWRSAAVEALGVVELGVLQADTPRSSLMSDKRRPDAAEMQRALRRIARCFRGAAYAVADSRGLGERAP